MWLQIQKILSLQSALIFLIAINVYFRFDDVVYIKNQVELFFNRDEVYDPREEKVNLRPKSDTLMIFLPINPFKDSDRDILNKIYFSSLLSKFVQSNTKLKEYIVVNIFSKEEKIDPKIKSFLLRSDASKSIVIDTKNILRDRYLDDKSLAIVSFDSKNNPQITEVSNEYLFDLFSSKVLSLIDSKSNFLSKLTAKVDPNSATTDDL